mmetsp:Transcript_16632/g.24444  ORF Transcript_16632/g.24444 Transcript_16632/m.24444 type:complete len:179 (-) Transcript_16632:112-648(-)
MKIAAKFIACAILAATTVESFLSHQNSFSRFQNRHSHFDVVMAGWSDPNWNWGSPFGTAHDLAMNLRSKLSSRDSRVIWLEKLLNHDIDMEEVKLALGLRIQHASRQRIDGNGAGWNFMEMMKDCKYEGREDLLIEDLKALVSSLDAENVLGDKGGSSNAKVEAAKALCGMRFIDDGL